MLEYREKKERKIKEIKHKKVIYYNCTGIQRDFSHVNITASSLKLVSAFLSVVRIGLEIRMKKTFLCTHTYPNESMTQNSIYYLEQGWPNPGHRLFL